jgi:hypothetical protein
VGHGLRLYTGLSPDLDARRLHRCVGPAHRRDVTSHHRQRRRTDPDTLLGKCNMTQTSKNCCCPRSRKLAANSPCAKPRDKVSVVMGMWKERGREGTSHEMGTALAWSWRANRCARVELFTAGSATMENLPTYLERGGSAKRSATSSSDH